MARGLQSHVSRSRITKMRRPKRRRDNPKARVVRPPPHGVDLDAVAKQVAYKSSDYHSTATRIRRPRPDASKCPPEVSKDLERVERWLREAIAQGWTGVWDKGFPRYVWRRVGDVIYEARQGSPGSGVDLDPCSGTWLESRPRRPTARSGAVRGEEGRCSAELRDGPWPSVPRVQVTNYENAQTQATARQSQGSCRATATARCGP